TILFPRIELGIFAAEKTAAALVVLFALYRLVLLVETLGCRADRPLLGLILRRYVAGLDCFSTPGTPTEKYAGRQPDVGCEPGSAPKPYQLPCDHESECTKRHSRHSTPNRTRSHAKHGASFPRARAATCSGASKFVRC